MVGLMKPGFSVVLVAGAIWVGCHSADDAPFDTYQLCFDQQTEVQLQPVIESIVECCIDHAIAAVKPACQNTVSDCINYLTANLVQTDASTVEVHDGCQAYITEITAPAP